MTEQGDGWEFRSVQGHREDRPRTLGSEADGALGNGTGMATVDRGTQRQVTEVLICRAPHRASRQSLLARKCPRASLGPNGIATGTKEPSIEDRSAGEALKSPP